MRINLNGHRIGLDSGRMLSIRACAGSRIKVLSGDVWLTQDNDRTDYLLAAGEQMVLANALPVIVQAERDAELAIYERACSNRTITRALPWLRALRNALSRAPRKFQPAGL